MGEVGRWDPVLFARYRAARVGGARRQRLLAELYRTQHPLLTTLTAQVCGRGETTRGKRLHNRMMVRFARRVEWEDAMGAAAIAFVKALDQFDPGRGGFPMYLKRKIYYELQCVIARTGAVTTPRDLQAPTEYFADDDHAGRVLTAASELEEDDELEPLPAANDIAGELLEAADHLEEDIVGLEVAVPDTRSALEILLEEELLFARHARFPAIPVRARYERLAFALGELPVRGALSRALEERGVRTTRARVEWSPTPVDCLVGVSLQS